MPIPDGADYHIDSWLQIYTKTHAHNIWYSFRIEIMPVYNSAWYVYACVYM